MLILVFSIFKTDPGNAFSATSIASSQLTFPKSLEYGEQTLIYLGVLGVLIVSVLLTGLSAILVKIKRIIIRIKKVP